MTNVKLNKRLLLVAEKVLANSEVLDVGCDHALLDIYLIQNKLCKRAVASDIKEGPIACAKKNIQKYGLSSVIETRVGSGIQTIDENIDTIVISGMGGLNMNGILKYYPNLLKNVRRIILSPNNYVVEVREEISKLGFSLIDEDLVEDGKYIYPVLVFEKGKSSFKRREYVFGPILLQKKGPLFRKYLEEQKKAKEFIAESMPKKYFFRRYTLKRQIKELCNVLEKLEKKL